MASKEPRGAESFLLTKAHHFLAGILTHARALEAEVTTCIRTRLVSKQTIHISGLQKGPAERGHVKKRQKSSKSVKKFFDTFRQISQGKKRQKSSKNVKKFFDTFRQISRGTIFPAPLGGL